MCGTLFELQQSKQNQNLPEIMIDTSLVVGST